jgi:two-component system, chemotaxis family, chemotaxis protein CheY
VTMDLTMPGMDGLGCIPELLAAHPRAGILVVSALTDKSTAIRALRLGAHGFLPKPFDDDALQIALLALIKNRS